MAEESKAVSRRWLDEFWSAGNLVIADEIFAPTYVRYDPEGPMIGLDTIRRFVAAIRADIPDLYFTADDVVAEGDRVVVRWTATGTHASVNRRIRFTGMDILRIREEKIIESWPCFDRLAIEQQLSATSRSGQISA
jgi:predicted ester cyclase